MIDVAHALELVLGRAVPLPPRVVSLPESLGRFLAETIAADLDLPPFDKALMDGFAVRSSDVQGAGPHRFAIGEEITAGRTPTRPLAPREAAVIMTGAPLPDGADAVVMHEKTTIDGGGYVLIPGPIRPGEARLTRGREMRKGQVLFEPGERLNALKLGVLAAVGRPEVLVTPAPKVVIVPTGDELVGIGSVPGPGRIRETNSTVLAALARTVGAEPVVLPVAPDEPEALRNALADALAERPDVLLVCGGVSAGKRDLVPEALASIGVTTLFHKVRLKPGKPLLFGVRTVVDDRRGHPPTLVFGLPGNPVSGIVGFLLFVEPALRRMLGSGPSEDAHRYQKAILETEFRHRGDRPTFHPARSRGRDGFRVTPLDWAGSSDLFTVSRADGFIRFAEGDRDYPSGETVEFLPLVHGRI